MSTGVPCSEPYRRGETLYLWAVSLMLAGYALLGRGFAYAGMSPIYIGEMVLVLGVAAALPGFCSGKLFRIPPIYMLFPVMLWGGVRTMPFVKEYGAYAFRDAALWGYSAFALITASILIANPRIFARMLIRYRYFAVIFLYCAWAIFVFRRISGIELKLPGAPAALGISKAGDILVHLAGITAFLMAGMGHARWDYIILSAITFLVSGTANRGGSLAFIASACVVAVFRPARFRPGPLLYGMILAVVLLGLFDPVIHIHRRTLSARQLWMNFASIAGDSDAGLEGTKQWRIAWWSDIVGYTVGGRYFWTGKGFGINLATDDGYQVTRDGSLRSPHNVHLTILARAGVPGFVFWAAAHMSWLFCMVSAAMASRRNGDYDWYNILIFLIAYYVAFVVNSAFDVFMEGPAGGIWFWTIYGAGAAALYLRRENPECIRI